MLPIYDGLAAGEAPRSTPKHSGDHPLKGKRIYIPPMAYGSARAFASAFRAIGLDAEPTPPSDHRTRELGARYTSGDECYPAKVTVGDFMKVVENPAIDNRKIALFMPTAQGPCRFGQYAPYLRQILDANGYAEVEILSPTSQNAYDGLGTLAGAFVRTGWRALLAADLLQKLLLMYRPYEERRGDSEQTYEDSLADLCGTLEQTAVEPGVQLEALRDCMVRGRDRFRRLGSAARPIAAADRDGGRDLLPAEYVQERQPGGGIGTVRRRGLAERHRRMDLVHEFGALPEAETGRASLDVGGSGRVGAQACAEARRARAGRAVPRRFRWPRRAGHLRGSGMRAPLSAAGGRVRRDGAERRARWCTWRRRERRGSSTSARSRA